AVIDLSALDGTNGFRLNGAVAYDQSGISVSGAGDFNGDGFADILIGAWKSDSAYTDSGSAYVVFGAPTQAATISLGSLDGRNGVCLVGDADGFSGAWVSGVGDVNGDGLAEVMVGGSTSGATYVVFGQASGSAATLDLATLDGSAGFSLIFDGNEGDGLVVSGAGDVNGDGFADLIVGAGKADSDSYYDVGASFVVFGRASGFGSPIDLALLDGVDGFRLEGAWEYDQSGVAVSGAGDINGDGFDDLLVGAYGVDRGEEVSVGASYVVFGRGGAFAPVTLLSGLDGRTGFRLEGVAAQDFSGYAVSRAGDIDGDGFDDLLIGAYGADLGAVDTGASYLFLGGNLTEAPTTALSLGGSSAAEILRGGLGADSLTGAGGADVLIGGAGDDLLFVGDTTFLKVDGGGGRDLLRLEGSGLALDLSLPGVGTRIQDIEIVDLGVGNTLKIDVAARVSGISGSDRTLRLMGDGSDRLLLGDAWSFTADAVVDGGLSYDLYVNGGNRLLVDAGIEVLRSVVSLASLDGGKGFRLAGEAYDASGVSVAGAGDINGDGLDDFIIGAMGASPGFPGAGSSYVVFGNVGGFSASIDLADPLVLDGVAGFRIDGAAAADLSGISVAGAGDVNGDGFDDLFVGALRADPNGSDSGAGYVIFGKAGGFTPALDLSSLDGTSGFRLDGGAAGDFTSASLTGAGDVNGDGLDDLIIGAHQADSGAAMDAGASYVVFGKTGGFAATLNLATLDGVSGFRLSGGAAFDSSGFAVSSAGDVNGDGFDDIVIGAYQADPGSLADSGASYVIFGGSLGFAAEISLSGLDGSTGFRLNGVAVGDQSGYSVSGAGDINGDGFDDLLIGAPYADTGGGNSGASYVLFGQATWTVSVDLASLDGTAGFRLDGILAGDQSGNSVAGAGDINGDGFDDLLIGSNYADPSGVDSGMSHVVFGKAGGFAPSLDLTTLDALSGLRLDGVAAGDKSGYAVSGAGDVNGDGFDDVLIGAYTADVGGTGSGATYVVFGGNFGQAPVIPQSLVGSGIADILRGGLGADTLTGGGGADLLIGGGGNDLLIVSDATFRRVDGGSGDDILFLAGTGLALDLAAIGMSNRIQEIETIDLGVGSGNNTLKIDLAARVSQISGSGEFLKVMGDGADRLYLGDTWTVTANHTTDAGESYDLYQHGGNRLLVDSDIFVTRSIISLSSLDGTNGFRLDGVAGYDVSGVSVNGAGDVNNDGYADVLIGAQMADAPLYNSGASYLFFGAASGFAPQISLSTLNGTTGFRLSGVGADDYCGNSVSGAGDINGDGFADFIVGARMADSGSSDAGASYVIFGKASGFSSQLDPSTLNGTTGFRLDGVAAGDRSGWSVDGAGDVNGDGLSDIIVGAVWASPDAVTSGASYVVFGKTSGFASQINLSTLDGTSGFRLDGAAVWDGSGLSVSGAGDVNGDGFDDVIIDSPRSQSGTLELGTSYVVFGKGSGFTAQIDLATLDGTTGFRMDDLVMNGFGNPLVSGAGDVNGDGFDDLIVGGPAADHEGTDSGSCYIVFGKASGFTTQFDLSTLNGTNGFRLDGLAAGDETGRSVSSAGDVNGDGLADLIVGAFHADTNGGDSGASYVIYGRTSGFAAQLDLATLDGATGFRLDGAAAGDNSGHSVSGAGDVNSDGFDDLLVGAPWADAGGEFSGSTFVVFGGNFAGAPVTSQTLSGSGIADVLLGGLGADTLIGGGGADLLIGGAGNDLLTISDATFRQVDGGSGLDTLKLATDFNLNLMVAGMSPRIENIEIIDLGVGSDNHILTARQWHFSQLFGEGAHLRILGDSNDVLHIGVGWGYTAGYETSGGETFDLYSKDGVSLLIDNSIGMFLDPVVLDLAGDGLDLVDCGQGRYFDMGLTGLPHATGWVGAGDAFLALDRNHDGRINDAGELFSERMFPDAHSGMEALSRLDTNQDHRLDALDDTFAELRVWQDANQDGVSDPEELTSLPGRGIDSVSLETTASDYWRGNNQILSEGRFGFADGGLGRLMEVAFLHHPDEIPPTLGVSATPADGGAASGGGAGFTLAEALGDFLPATPTSALFGDEGSAEGGCFSFDSVGDGGDFSVLGNAVADHLAFLGESGGDPLDQREQGADTLPEVVSLPGLEEVGQQPLSLLPHA
ncbi:MAG: FG-GAP repeat protein, partial [Magnetococcales bacterium]|nr:FG-GAP repeat protein [Magnetococcales bacterium]